MVARKRDYKAEYQRAKQRAIREGFKSERERKASRRYPDKPIDEAKRARNRSERIRRESRLWSAKHSKQLTSRYSAGWSDERVQSYYDAYVADVDEGEDKLSRLYDYLVDESELVEPEEWESLYVGE
jgi:hypothetical protein